MAVLDDLEKRFGKGQTLAPSEIKRVLGHGVPYWLLLGGRTLSDPDLASRCKKAADALEDLYEKVAPRLGMTVGGTDA